MGVDLCGGKVFVSEQFLNDSDATSSHEVRCERVPQDVRMDRSAKRLQARGFYDPLDLPWCQAARGITVEKSIKAFFD